MGKYKALRNLTIGDGKDKDENGRHIHRQVMKNEVFECADEFADQHLHAHVEETDEPVTAVAKVEARKAAKAAAKAPKVEEPPKKEDKGGKGGK